MVNHRADPSHGESPSRIARSEELSRPRLETKATGEEKATAACMGPASTASPGTIQYDPKMTTVRATMEAHRTSVVVFAPCPSTSRYWYARRFGSSKDINGTTGRTAKRPGSRPPPELVRPSSHESVGRHGSTSNLHR